MKFNLHGFYKIHRQGQIIEIIASGTWNLEAAQAFMTDMNKAVDGLNGQPFATLVDTQMWDLGTPEFQQGILEGTKSIIERDMVLEAYVAGIGGVKMAQLKAMTPEFSGYERRFFDSHIEGILWLEENGFKLIS